MSVQKVFDILDEIKAHSVDIEMLDEAELYASSSLGSTAWRALDLYFSANNISKEEVLKLRPRLLDALVEISCEEAKEILEKIQGTEYEPIMAQSVIGSKNLSFRKKIKIFGLFWPERDFGAENLDKFIKRVQDIHPEYAEEASARIDATRKKEKFISALYPLRDLYKQKIVNDDIVGLTLDILVYNDPGDKEEISEELTKRIAEHEDKHIIELIISFWTVVASETAERKLRRQFLDTTDPIVKENTKRALIYMGKNPVTFVEGDQIMGDNINLTGDFRGANVPIKTIINDATIVVTNSQNFDEPTKKALEELLQKLDKALSDVPKENEEEAKAIADTAKNLVDAANQKKPNKPTITITAEGLLKAAKNLAKVIPVIVPIVKQIIALITQ